MKGLLIAGPCSAESEEQVLQSAIQVRDAGIGLFRAGLWKPRTRPGGFEGVGEAGIGWLVAARERTGLDVCTEAACAGHVRICLDNGITTIWLGARTVADPFAVQDIADALRAAGGCRRILVKNPPSPDLELWLGAIERLQGCGEIVAVHRGFKGGGSGPYRNDPLWELAVEFRAGHPSIPLLCDPSHIAGTRELVPEIAQRALDLGFDGLMIETHPNPSEALSDSAQQLSPKELEALLALLVERGNSGSDPVLEELRARLDAIDEQLLSVIAGRMEVCRNIGEVKKRGGLPIIQPGRWEEVMRKVESRASELGLDKAFARRIFEILHAESVSNQE